MFNKNTSIYTKTSSSKLAPKSKGKTIKSNPEGKTIKSNHFNKLQTKSYKWQHIILIRYYLMDSCSIPSINPKANNPIYYLSGRYPNSILTI